MVTYHAYNLTAFTTNSSTNIMVVFVQETSKQVGYLPGAFILISLWLVLFLAMRARGSEPKVCLATASWAMTMVAILMYPLQIVNPTIFILAIMATPLSILILWLMSDG